MAKRKGQYVCGKCGRRFEGAIKLATHVSEEHKRPSRGGRQRPAGPKRNLPKFKGSCEKCGRDTFVNKFSFAQHRRFCKGSRISVVPPIPAETAGSFSGMSLVELMRKKGSVNGGVVERLKSEAAELRAKSDEILKYVEQFETGAAKFLSR